MSLLTRAPILSDQSPTLMTSFNPHLILEAPSPNVATLVGAGEVGGARASPQEFGGNRNSVCTLFRDSI